LKNSFRCPPPTNVVFDIALDARKKSAPHSRKRERERKRETTIIFFLFFSFHFCLAKKGGRGLSLSVFYNLSSPGINNRVFATLCLFPSLPPAAPSSVARQEKKEKKKEREERKKRGKKKTNLFF
jgi:hypothetical protein